MAPEILVFSSERKREDLKLQKSRYIYYSDISKSTGGRQTFPKNFVDIPIADVETEMDLFLKARWSLHDKPDEIWPKLRTVEDPKKKTVLRIEEFPIKVDGLRILSIKKSFRVDGNLKALSYRLAELT